MKKHLTQDSEYSYINGNPLSGQTVVITGSLCGLSKRDTKKLVVATGGTMRQMPHNKPSVLIIGREGKSSEVDSALRFGAKVITERDLLDMVGATSILDKLIKEAHDFNTPRNRLYRLASVVPEAVIDNPIWKDLYAKDPEFIATLPGSVKLKFLSLINKTSLAQLADVLRGINLKCDIFQVESAHLLEDKSICLSHSFQAQSCFLTLICSDLDADLEDVGIGCEDKLPLATAITAYLLNSLENLQDIASECGLFYEPSMSPRNGYPMHPESIELRYGERLYEWAWDNIPIDEELICTLLSSDDGLFYLPDSYKGAIGPIFTDPPIFDESQAEEGILRGEWNTECYLPIVSSESDCSVFIKGRISECFEFRGHGLSDYSLSFTYQTPLSLEAEIEDLLSDRSIGRLLVPHLNSIFNFCEPNRE